MNKLTQPDDEPNEVISALADGQLGGEAFARAAGLAVTSASARASWHTYHLIGDVLRSGELAAGSPAVDFVQKFQQRLASESAMQSQVRPAVVALPERQAVPLSVLRAPANAPLFRWKMLAGVASLAAVAAMVLNVSGVTGIVSPQGVLAQAPAAPVVAATVAAGGDVAPPVSAPVMIRNPRLDELLAAHRQSGGASALQMPAGFLRNATHETPGR